MPIETRSRTGKKPPPKPHFDEITSLATSKKAKPKALIETSEADQPVSKKAKGNSRRRKAKGSESTTSTLSAESGETQQSRPLEVLTEDEECEIVPQHKDMTKYRQHYEKLADLFQTLFTPDPELAAAYFRVEKETNRELKKLKKIKSKAKNEPAKALSHTPMGKKLFKMKGRRQHEKDDPETIEEEVVRDSSFESVASSKASVNCIQTPVKTPGRALRSRKIRKSVLAVPKSPWVKERVTRAKAKKGNGKKEKPPKAVPSESKQRKPITDGNESIIILSPKSSEPLQVAIEEAKPAPEIELKKNKKPKTRPAKRKVEDSENEKGIFKVPSDFNFENQQKPTNPPRKQRILSEANENFDRDPHQSSAGDEKASSKQVEIKQANLNPIVVIEKLDLKKPRTAKTANKESITSTHSVVTTTTKDTTIGGPQSVPPNRTNSYSKIQDVTGGVGHEGKPNRSEPKLDERSKKSSLKDTSSSVIIAVKETPLGAKLQLLESEGAEKAVGNAANKDKFIGKDETKANTYGCTFLMPSPTDGNNTVYIDCPNDTPEKAPYHCPDETFSKPELTIYVDRPNETFTKPEEKPTNVTIVLNKNVPDMSATCSTPVANATFVVPQKEMSKVAIQPLKQFQDCNSTYVLPKEQDLNPRITQQQQRSTQVQSNGDQTFAVPASAAIVSNDNNGVKKLPPVKEHLTLKVTKQDKLKPKLSGQDNNGLKNKFSKGSSSSSVCSSESVSSTTSKGESVAGTSRGTPKSNKVSSVSTSKDRFFDAGSHSKPPTLANLELKKQADAERMEKKRMEGAKKKEMYLQQKQDMQRKKNEEWKAKIEKKKAEEEAERQARAEQESNKGYVKSAVQAICKLLPGQSSRPLNPALSKVMKSSAASAASCPDIHNAGTSATAASASSCSSMSNLKTQSKCVQIAQKVFGSVDQLQTSTGVTATEKVKAPAPIMKQMPPTKPMEPHNFLMPSPPVRKEETKPPVDDIFDISDDESFATVGDKTLDGGENINTYEITVYEDLDENMEHRANKRIPDWANDRTRLNRSLFLQQPALLGIIRRTAFPQKNIGYKLFPNVPF